MADKSLNFKTPVVIKTARSVSEINSAVNNGFTPLIRKLVPSEMLFQRYGVFQNRKTKEIEVAEDYEVFRQYGKKIVYDDSEWELVVPFFYYYPYIHQCPIAAYLIPPNLSKGEEVIVEDVIEDIYGGDFWGPVRLDTLKAIWDGTDLLLQIQEGVDDVSSWVG